MLDLRKGDWKDEEAKGGEGSATLTFRIEGMSCSCEGQIVEKRVKALKGVKSFSLNPITNQMKVICDPIVSVEDIQRAVSKAGVKAVLLPPKK